MLEVGERDVRERAEEKAKQLQEELGDPIQLGFRLPNGCDCMKTLVSRPILVQFRCGHSIGFIKATICAENELPTSVVLISRGQRLLDPLSVSDCRTIEPGNLNIIDIQEAT